MHNYFKSYAWMVALLTAIPFLGFGNKNNTLSDIVNSDWWTTIQQRLIESEYEIRWQDKVNCYQSPNRAQNLRFSYYTDGFKAEPRVYEKDDFWYVLVRLTSISRDKNSIKFEGGKFNFEDKKLSVTGNLLKIEYENNENGMRQNFILPERLKGKNNLQLNFEVDLLNVAMNISNDKIVYYRTIPGGASVMYYLDMKVIDAEGKEISAHFDKYEKGFAIVVNDENAIYPITIDPLSQTPNWTAEGNQELALYGISVATAGDVNGDGYSDIIVGALWYDNGQEDEGIAFVYHGSADGLATSPNWTGEANQAYAHYGNKVSTAGDINGDGYSDVIVGAPDYDGGVQDIGAAFIYYGSASGLSTSPYWTGQSNQANAHYGCAVACAGDVNGDGYSDVVVGAYAYDNGETDEGRAYVYHGSSLGLPSTPNWTNESNQANAYFGISVATAGDVNGDGYSDLIVGASYYDGSQTDEGRAYVYHGSASGLSTTPNWTGQSNQTNAHYGSSISTAGDVNGDGYSDVIIGIPEFDNNETNEGRAYIYHGSASGLSTLPVWFAEPNQTNAYFGNSVATAGDVNGDGYSDVIVGAYLYDNGETNEGAVFVYYGSASGTSTTPNWTNESNQASANYGFEASTAGDVNGDGYSDVIVGAPQYTNGQNLEGAAFAYYGSASGLSTIPSWTNESNQIDAYFGFAVSIAGDVNGDGYSDIIVGAHYYDNGETNEGAAFIYHGSATGVSTTPNWTGESNQANAYYGAAVATAGDVNGDGYSDVVVGAYLYDNGETDEGRAYVYHGSASGLSTTPNWIGESNQTNARYGFAVSSAGDVNGDGYSDVVVGAPQYTFLQSNEGAAFAYHGSATGLSPTYGWSARSNQSFSGFGYAVSNAGDVNGDGYSDVIIGALLYDNGEADEGRAYVYHGSSSGLSSSPNWITESNQISAQYGRSVSTAGDVNGDRYSDVIIGAWRYDNGQTDEGRAYFYRGSASGLSTTPNWIGESNQDNAQYGVSVSTAGDVNGDGYSDVIIGAYFYDNGETDEGRAYVYHGSASGLPMTPNWIGESNQANAYYGVSVASAGDVNGDGYSDVIVGAYFYDNGQTNEGMAYVYYGNEGMGVNIKPEQMRADFSRQIVPPLFSYSNTSFGSRFYGRSNYGRVIAKAQFEVKRLGLPFNGLNLVETSWINLGTAGQQISQLISGLLINTCYKWRARIKYHPKYGAPIHSRWYYIQTNGLTETDFRTGVQVGVSENDDVLPSYAVNLMVDYLPGKIRFKYSGLEDQNGMLIIYNLLGSEVKRIPVSGTEYEWRGKDKNGNLCGSGVYFARITAGNIVSNSVKFVLF
ncbi:MAG: FG-GAP-like repeat-containing protein [candidate division WOR-3 bacterium]|nr:FG-GAP-like repeat-containing protein [candidate division WOR-3 bacterium]